MECGRPVLTVDEVREKLRVALRHPLPGGRAQRLMAPTPRPGWDPEKDPPGDRPAAALALISPLSPDSGSPESADIPAGLLLTERTKTVETHRGQISFPGGVMETGETPEQTAVREAYEEVALPLDLPQLLGRLSPLWIPASGYTVTPIVATSDRRPTLRANPVEVDRILEVPLTDLLEPGAVKVEARSRGEFWRRVPFFDVEGSWLWGATAMMVAELLVMLGWEGPHSP